MHGLYHSDWWTGRILVEESVVFRDGNEYIPIGYDLPIPTPTIGTPPPIPITHHGSQIPPHPPPIG
jgi:hypothetical protein